MRALFTGGSVVFALFLTLANETMPAQTKAEDQVVYKKHTVLNLDGSELRGQRERPAGEIFISRRKTGFDKIIKIRQNFRIELLSSSSEL